MESSQLARALLLIGAGVLLAGLLLLVATRLGLGRLPGDLVLKTKHVTFYSPIATSLIVSVVLTVVLNLWLRRR